MKIQGTSEYKAISIEEAFSLLETSTDGLTESEAVSRVLESGYNEIVERKEIHLLNSFLVIGDQCHCY